MGTYIKHGVSACVISIIIAVSFSAHAFATMPGQNGAITFSSTRDSILDYEIYTMNPDGSDPRRISNTAGHDHAPVWSPDGSKIAFYTLNRNGNFAEIYTMNADGTNQVGVVTGGNAIGPSWSPDGTKLAYQGVVGGNTDIYTVNVDGTNVQRLTNVAAADGSPSWSPDGSKIAFYSLRNGNIEVYTMNCDGTNQTRLTTNAALDIVTDISPDNSKIMFVSNRSGNYQFYTMDLAGGNVQQVGSLPTPNTGSIPSAKWSPDGTKIVFSVHVGTAGGALIQRVYTMNSDGSNMTPITLADQYSDINPSWQPLSQPYIPTIPRTAPAILTYTSLGTHPSASSQPSTLGKRISSLFAYNGKLYPAYGDGNDNHGPVNVEPYNLATRSYMGNLLTVPSEALSPFSVLNGTLYTLTYDPVGSGPAGYGMSTNNGDSWTLSLPITARHLLSIQSYKGELFTGGAEGTAAIIWRSTDGGTTWPTSLSRTSPYSTNPRFNWIYEMNGLLYAQASVPSAPVEVFDGTTWTTATTASVNYVNKVPVLFKGKLVSQLNGMSVFDGTTVSKVNSFTGFVRNFYVDGDYLYVLRDDNNEIVRSSDLTTWESLGSAPSDAYSLAVYNNRIYIGAYNSLIYESSLIPSSLASAGAGATLAQTGDNLQAMQLWAMFLLIIGVSTPIAMRLIPHMRRFMKP